MLWRDGNGYGYDDGWHMMNGDGGSAWVMLVLVVLVVLALGGAAAAIVMAVRQSSVAPAPPSVPPESSARRVLDERFCRGEIDEDEYRRRRSILLENLEN